MNRTAISLFSKTFDLLQRQPAHSAGNLRYHLRQRRGYKKGTTGEFVLSDLPKDVHPGRKKTQGFWSYFWSDGSSIVRITNVFSMRREFLLWRDHVWFHSIVYLCHHSTPTFPNRRIAFSSMYMFLKRYFEVQAQRPLFWCGFTEGVMV